MDEKVIRMVLKLRDDFTAQLAKLSSAVDSTMAKVNRSFATNPGIKKFEGDISDARREVRALEGELAILGRMKPSPEVDLQTRKARAELRLFQAQLAVATRKRTINIDIDKAKLQQAGRAFEQMKSSLDQTVASGTLFGRVMTAALLALGPLVSLLMAAAGAAVALASSLGAAAIALGGVASAAAAQAVPAIGLLIASFQRLGKVMEAVKAGEQASASAGADHTAQIERQRAAAENLRRAHEQVRDAERNLSDARRQARRDLEDLTLTLRRNRLEAESAALSAGEAQQAVRLSVARGESSRELSRAQIGRESAGIDLTMARRTAGRAEVDAAREMGGGVEQMRGVEQARRGVRDATLALAAAQRESAEAAKAESGAVSGLNQALKDLTPAERKLLESIERLKADWKQISASLTAPIIESFTHITDGIRSLINNPEIQGALKGLSEQMGKSISGFFDAINTPANRQIFVDLTNQAKETFPLITESVANLFGWFGEIARAAGPLFKDILTGFRDWTGDLKKGAGDREGLEDFFSEMGVHLKAWLGLLGAVWDLLKEVFGASKDTGLSLVEDLTENIKEFTTWIRENKDLVRAFFEDAGDVARAVGTAVVALTVVLAKAFSSEWLVKLADAFTEVFVPALGIALTFIGEFLGLLADLVTLPWVKDFVIAGVAVLLVAKAFGLVITAVKNLSTLFLAFRGILTGLGLAAGPAGWIIIGIVAIVTILIVLEQKFGVVTKTIEALKTAAEATIDWIKENWEKLILLIPLMGPMLLLIIKQFNNIKTAVVTVFNFIKNVFTTTMEFIEKHPVLNAIKTAITKPFTIAFDLIKNAFSIFEGVFRNFWKILGGISDIMGGEWKKGFTAIFDGLKGVGETIFKGIYGAIRAVWNGIADVWEPIKDAINDASPFGDLPSLPKMPEWGSDAAVEDKGADARGDTTRASQFGGGLAAGGVVTAAPGGRKVVVGEGGHDEFVITTDPRFGARSMQLMSALMERVAKRGMYARGGVPDGFVQPFPGGNWEGSPEGHQSTRALGNWQSDHAWDIMGSGKVYAVLDGTIGRVSNFLDRRPQFAGGSAYLTGTRAGDFFYKHIDPSVSSGQKVKAGDLIGDTSPVTWVNGGPHLHLGASASDYHAVFAAIREGGPVPDSSNGATATSTGTSTGTGGRGSRKESFEEYFKRLTGKEMNKRNKYLVKWAKRWFPGDRKTDIPTGGGGGDDPSAATPSRGGGSNAVLTAIVRAARENDVDPAAMVAVAMYESSLNPNAVGDGGHSVGLFQLHDRGAGSGMSVEERKDPYTNASVAARGLARITHEVGPDAAEAMVRRFENPANPDKWAAVARRNYPTAVQKIEGYAAGGEIPGEGQPVDIRAHGGEMILNRMQQAALGGQKFLRKKFGFQQGGVIPTQGIPTPVAQPPQLGLPDPPPGTFFIGEFGKAVSQIMATMKVLITDFRKLGDKAATTVKGFGNVMKKFFETVDDQMELLDLEYEKLTTEIEQSVTRAQFKFDKSGQAIRAFGDDSEVKALDVEIEGIGKQRKFLLGKEGVLEKIFKIANQKLRQARRMMEQADTPAERAEARPVLEEATRGQIKARQDLLSTRTDLASLAATQFERREARRGAVVTRALAGQRIGGATAPERLATLDLQQAVEGPSAAGGEQREAILAEQMAGLQQARATQATVKTGPKTGRRTVPKDPALDRMLNDAILTLQAQMGRAAVEGLRASFTANMGRQQTGQRMAEVIGQGAGAINDWIQGSMNLTSQQITSLGHAANRARQQGNVALAEEIEDEIRNLNVSIKEMAKQQIQNTVTQVNRNASRTIAAGDRAARIAGLQTDRGIDFGATGIALAGRGAALATQQQGLRGALAAAQAGGFVELSEDLADQIADLDVTMAENNRAIRDNTQAMILGTLEDRNRAAVQAMAVGDVEMQIAAISGPGFTTNFARQVNILQERTGSLQTVGGNLRAALSDAISSGMPQDTINSLTLQLKQNELAILQNSQQLMEVSGALMEPQQFSSFSWRAFRQAVFTGEGSLLSGVAAAVPHLQSGGTITRSGLAYIHAGERVVPPGSNGGGDNITLNITSPTEVADPTVLASKFAFEYKGRR